MTITKEDILLLLEQNGIPYELAEHEAVFTIEEMNRLGLKDADCIAKNLFIRDDKKRQYFLVTLEKDKQLDLKALQAAIGSRRLSFASETDLDHFLGLAKGEVTPFGLLNDRGHRVVLLIDAAFKGRKIGVHPNENTATVWMRTEELLRLLEQSGSRTEWLGEETGEERKNDE